MKRIIPLILTVLLLPVLLAVPARADETELLEVLNYSFPNDGTNTLVGVTPANNVVSFQLPFSTQVFYLDIIVTMTSLKPVNIYLVVGNNEKLLEKETIVGTTYRIFGDGISNITRNFSLRFEYADGATGTSWVTFKSVKVSLVSMAKLEMSAVGTVYDYSTSPSTNTTISYQGDGVSHTVDLYASSTTHNSYRATLVLYDWVKYDYVDVLVSTFCQNIASIQVQLNGQYVPFDVSTVSNVTGNNTTLFIVAVRIDLTGVTRDSADELLFNLTATTPVNVASNFSIQSVTGSIVTTIPDANVTWYQKIINAISTWGQNIVNALGGSNDASGVQDSINSAVGELEQAGAALDAVQRPDIGHVNIDVAGMVDPVGLSGVASIVGLFTGNTLIYSIMLMFLTLALISYIIFGKR